MYRLPKLSQRLKTIADLTPQNSIIADIGTDHAYIPVYLANKGEIKRAIASDVKSGPLRRAASTIKEFNASEKVEVRLGNGLESVNIGEVDTVIIAGMGGILISEILENSKEILSKIKTLILQPMTAVYELRKYLNENEYLITNERLAKEDDKLYTVIQAVHGSEVIEKDLFFHIGKRLTEQNDRYLPELIERHITKLNKQINGLSSALITSERQRKIDECKSLLSEILELKLEILQKNHVWQG